MQLIEIDSEITDEALLVEDGDLNLQEIMNSAPTTIDGCNDKIFFVAFIEDGEDVAGYTEQDLEDAHTEWLMEN